MSELPLLAPVPPDTVRSKISSDEWDACVNAWIMLMELRVAAPEKMFQEFAPKDTSAVSFLTSFYHELATSPKPNIPLTAGPKGKALRKLCFLLTRRILLEQITEAPFKLLRWTFLGDLCCCYPSSIAVNRLLSEVWDKYSETITSSLNEAKILVTGQLSQPRALDEDEIASSLRRLTILASVVPSAGHVLMTGSDFLDAVSDGYQVQQREASRKMLAAVAYVGLTSLLKGAKPNMSLLLDHLFSLKANAGVATPKMTKGPTLLSDLICSSDLLARLERQLTLFPQKRGQDLVTSLRSYQAETKSLHRRYQRHKVLKKAAQKGKSRADETYVHIPEELHAHKMSLVTQIQDLFPELGPGYVVRLLDFYHDDTETIIANLLDNSLPTELQTLEKSEPLSASSSLPRHDPLPPRPTPPESPDPQTARTAPLRKNVFDQDVDIAELAITGSEASGKLRFGRAKPELTADAILADRSQHATNKAAILSALAAFDSDDDERDDTYDVADVGGTVDAIPTGPDAEAEADMRNRRIEESELLLLRHYKLNPGVFSRDGATRRGQPRSSLKQATGMTDEAIEGWAVMLARDPKRHAKLEEKLMLGAGAGPGGREGAGGGALNQPELPSTSYRKPALVEGDDSEGTEGSAGDRPPRLAARGGRGRGRGREGRGPGGAGGPPVTTSSPLSHQRKEQNKASRANHNRRNQRAKKIARGGGLPG